MEYEEKKVKKETKEYGDIVKAKKNEPYFEKTEKGFSEIPLAIVPQFFWTYILV